MANLPASFGQDNLNPVPKDKRSMTFFATFSLWVGAQFVATTILSGMLFVPDLPYTTAVIAILLGGIVGSIPLALTANIGTRTGLSTMVVARGAFGHRGALLPAAVNVVTLVGWSWVQAYLGGLSLNYAITYLTGYSNINLFVILTETLIVMITIYGHRGIEKTENIIAGGMLILSLIIFAFMFFEFNLGGLIYMTASNNPEITAVAAFDMVVATVFSQITYCCDFNRYCKSQKTGIMGTLTGMLFASLVAFSLGATVSGFSILAGEPRTYDPTILIGQVNPYLGLVAGFVIFLSVVSTNAMVLYSATMSYMAIFPKQRFWIPTLVLGIVCVMGALAKNWLVDNFQGFLSMIGTLFIPITAILIIDYYIINRNHYNTRSVLSSKKSQYQYKNGINYIAYSAYAIGAVFAYYFAYVHTISVGYTILTFLVTASAYLLLSRVFSEHSVKTSVENVYSDIT